MDTQCFQNMPSPVLCDCNFTCSLRRLHFVHYEVNIYSAKMLSVQTCIFLLEFSPGMALNTLRCSRVLARIPKLAVQKFFWEWPNISVDVVALKVFWDVANETVAIKHMCWSGKAIIVFLISGFKLLTSVLYAKIIIMDAQTWRICVCSNQLYPGIFNLFLTEKSMEADTGRNKLNIKTTIKNIRGMLKSL